MPKLVFVHYTETHEVKAKSTDTFWSLLKHIVEEKKWGGIHDLWVRDASGVLLEVTRPMEDYEFKDGTRLFISKAFRAQSTPKDKA